MRFAHPQKILRHFSWTSRYKNTRVQEELFATIALEIPAIAFGFLNKLLEYPNIVPRLSHIELEYPNIVSGFLKGNEDTKGAS